VINSCFNSSWALGQNIVLDMRMGTNHQQKSNFPWIIQGTPCSSTSPPAASSSASGVDFTPVRQCNYWNSPQVFKRKMNEGKSWRHIDFLELRDFNIISNQFSDIETPGPQQPSFCFEIIAPWVSGSPPGTRESLRPGTGMLIPRMESNVFEVFEAGSAALT